MKLEDNDYQRFSSLSLECVYKIGQSEAFRGEAQAAKQEYLTN